MIQHTILLKFLSHSAFSPPVPVRQRPLSMILSPSTSRGSLADVSSPPSLPPRQPSVRLQQTPTSTTQMRSIPSPSATVIRTSQLPSFLPSPASSSLPRDSVPPLPPRPSTGLGSPLYHGPAQTPLEASLSVPGPPSRRSTGDAICMCIMVCFMMK